MFFIGAYIATPPPATKASTPTRMANALNAETQIATKASTLLKMAFANGAENHDAKQAPTSLMKTTCAYGAKNSTARSTVTIGVKDTV